MWLSTELCVWVCGEGGWACGLLTRVPPRSWLPSLSPLSVSSWVTPRSAPSVVLRGLTLLLIHKLVVARCSNIGVSTTWSRLGQSPMDCLRLHRDSGNKEVETALLHPVSYSVSVECKLHKKIVHLDLCKIGNSLLESILGWCLKWSSIDSSGWNGVLLSHLLQSKQSCFMTALRLGQKNHWLMLGCTHLI